MDNLCHTLVGAAIGEAGLKSRVKHGNAVLMVASNLPDIDVLGFASGLPAVAIRRGWTHGVLSWIVLPVLFAGLVLAIERIRSRDSDSGFSALLLLSLIGVVIHVLMDWLNTYGVRLLMPFSNRWFYGDSLFIVDVWLWLILSLGVWLARRSGGPLPARLTLVAGCVYVASMVASATAAHHYVLDAWIEQHGSPPNALMVGPVPITPFHRAVIVDAGDAYYTGGFRWLPSPGTTFDQTATPRLETHPAVVRVREHPDIRAVLVWARFPYYELEPLTDRVRVTLRDMRFGPRLGLGARVGEVSVIVPN